jgi:hypothetical protein
LTFPGTASLIPTNNNPKIIPQPIPFGPGFLPAPSVSDRVLMADATLSDNMQIVDSLRDTYKYVGIQGGYFRAHNSPHMSGRLPAGGNLMMLDSHVEWRKFKFFHVRTQNPAYPGFWW